MNSNLKLVFVPVWLEKILTACNEGISTVLEPEKLSRILSRSDLDLYASAQSYLDDLLPSGVAESFSPHQVANLLSIPPATAKGEMETEAKRGYLYGFLPESENLPANPVFCAHHVGYDFVIVTVAQDQTSNDNASVIFMEAIIGILCSVHPFEEVAKFPVMASWLKTR